MTDIPFYQVDAFTSKAFGGNPAAVCPLDAWLADSLMQSMALENNLSETAFLVSRADGDYDLRWFTPALEVDLCGHATLASGHIVLERLDKKRGSVTFHTRSGALTVERIDGRLTMDFPARPPAPGLDAAKMAAALGASPREVLASPRDGFAVFAGEAEVRALEPDMAKIAELDCLGVIATAPGEDCDFVCRFFAPRAGIPEDPVTGSAYCTLIPYWSARLAKTEMFARQVSARGGEIFCHDEGNRVRIGGRAVLVIEGTFKL
jgi:PhzF family phenazine biosynthesis protein